MLSFDSSRRVRPRPAWRRITAVAGAGALAAIMFVPGAFASTDSDSTWQEDFAHPVTAVNTDQQGNTLMVADDTKHPAAQAAAPGYGMELFAMRALPNPVSRVLASPTATVPTGARVIVDVSGQSAAGSWSEWQTATPTTPAVFDTPTTAVQVRLTLWDNASGQSPTVSNLTLTGTPGAAANSTATPHGVQRVSYQVFATREGLVGGTTANGHIVQPNDHFVALPSGRGLSPQNSNQFSVQVCGPARCETAPVWDTGPWNTNDDYWDPPSVRAEYQDLAQGLPEAQAAYQNGYNGGFDDQGGRPVNPAGIDLADGTFFNVGLNDNGFVTVTYLWTQ